MKKEINNLQKIQEALKQRELKIINRLKRSSVKQDKIKKNISHRNQTKSKIIKQENSRPNYKQAIQLSTRIKKDYLSSIIGQKTRLNLREKGSFNGSILPITKEKFLCVYRNTEENFTSCFINRNFIVDPISYNKMNFNNVGVTDPRLIKTSDNKVLMSYSRHFENGQEAIAANIIMDLNESTSKIKINQTLRISPAKLTDRQKNWIPFVYENDVYFIATICPHQIYKIDLTGSKEAELVYHETWKHTWFNTNSLRGSTNPVLLKDGNYLSTFHTTTQIKHTSFYDNGFYIFEGKPPFKPLYCGFRTFLRAEDAIEPWYRKHNQILCPFPVAMVIEDKNVIISYGDNDSCVKILETNLDNIYKTMVKI